MKNTVNFGLSVTQFLTLIFVILKITKTIDWSWWWVLSPLWIPICFMGMFIGIVFLLVIILFED